MKLRWLKTITKGRKYDYWPPGEDTSVECKMQDTEKVSLQYCNELRNPITGEVTEFWYDVPVVIQEVTE